MYVPYEEYRIPTVEDRYMKWHVCMYTEGISVESPKPGINLLRQSRQNDTHKPAGLKHLVKMGEAFGYEPSLTVSSLVYFIQKEEIYTREA